MINSSPEKCRERAFSVSGEGEGGGANWGFSCWFVYERYMVVTTQGSLTKLLWAGKDLQNIAAIDLSLKLAEQENKRRPSKYKISWWGYLQVILMVFWGVYESKPQSILLNFVNLQTNFWSYQIFSSACSSILKTRWTPPFDACMMQP